MAHAKTLAMQAPIPYFPANALIGDCRRLSTSSCRPLGRVRDHPLAAARVAAFSADADFLSPELGPVARAGSTAQGGNWARESPIGLRPLVFASASRLLGDRADLP